MCNQAFAISNLTEENKSLNEMVSDQNEIITSLQSQIKTLKDMASVNKAVVKPQEQKQNENMRKTVKKEAPQVKAPAPKKEKINADDDIEFFESVINSGR
jgi:predicted RNase H-like nuclease (RuvC/YqgF family)